MHCTKIRELFNLFSSGEVLSKESVVILDADAGFGLSATGCLIKFPSGKRAVPKRTALFLNNRNFYLESDKLAKTNFQYEKRQKDLEKKRKKEEKLKKKLDKNTQPAADPDQIVAGGDAPVPGTLASVAGETEAK